MYLIRVQKLEHLLLAGPGALGRELATERQEETFCLNANTVDLDSDNGYVTVSTYQSSQNCVPKKRESHFNKLGFNNKTH